MPAREVSCKKRIKKEREELKQKKSLSNRITFGHNNNVWQSILYNYVNIDTEEGLMQYPDLFVENKVEIENKF